MKKKEVDLEVCDVDDRSHRCQCNVMCELGALESFGKRLSALQAKHNLLDREMAKLLDISERHYISVVTGKKEADISILNRIKQNFSVTIDYLLYGN